MPDDAPPIPPDHLPVLVLLNLKEGGLKVPGAVDAPVFDAAAMGGAIRVVSEPGTGSTFSFSAVFTVADPEDGIATGA